MTRHSGLVYCSNRCQHDQQHENFVRLWKAGLKKGTRGRNLVIARWLRRYLLEKMKHKCANCGWKKPHPNTGLPPLQVHHIDGNALNSKESNLTLLCPNCHALTPNFGGRNKQGRTRRMRLTKPKG